MPPPLRPHRKEKMSFWQAAGSQTASPVLLASHQGFVRQACSEPGAFKTPIMQQDSAGQKEQECFRQSCGHTGIIHSSVALWIFCESYKQKASGKRPAKTARSFDNWELYKFRKSSQEDLKFFFYPPLLHFFPLSASPIVRLLKSRVRRSHCEGDKSFDINHCVKVKGIQSSAQ